jgi:hypothetical protein
MKTFEPPPATALFQVGFAPPVTWEHLLRVNPELTLEQQATLAALEVGSTTLLHAPECAPVLVRRTR